MAPRFLAISALLGLVASGCTSATPNDAGLGANGVAVQVSGRALPAPTLDTASDAEYRLGPLDSINILVYQAPDLSGDFQVGSDGQIALPLIGNVKASGRTPQDVQREIAQKLEVSYMRAPQVSVKVTGFNSQKVTVDGGVQKPGSFPVVSGGGTLMQYIAQAGGMPRTADSSNVVIFRKVGTKKMAAKFDVKAIQAGRMPDPDVYGGDTIIVAQSGIRSAWQDMMTAMPLATFAVTAF